MPRKIQFSLLDEMQNTTKMNTQESKERKFEKKSKRNRVSCFNIYIVAFIFLSSTADVGRCIVIKKRNLSISYNYGRR